jgi:arylsulfatase A-like enzyme
VVWPQDPWAMPLNETFLSENLQDAGYYTAYFGKWHLGFFTKEHLPMKRGFNEQYGYYLGGEDYWDHSRTDGLDWHRNDTLETRENGTYSADLLGLAAATFITKMSTKDTPWYLYLPFQSVHSPLEAEDIDLAHYPDLSGTVKTRAGMISALDRAIGNVTHALVQTEQLDDVILLFTSDNGAPYGAAFDQGDDPAMMDALGMQTRGPPRTAPGPDRPPSGGNGTHTHGGGGGSNYPLSGWKHYVFGATQPATAPQQPEPLTPHASLLAPLAGG